MSTRTVSIRTGAAPAGEPCSTGCGRPATLTVEALHDGLTGYGYGCSWHAYDAEAVALRHLADKLTFELEQRRRRESARTSAREDGGV